MTTPDVIPYRLCCGKQHLGSICPDGQVMCCLCFSRFDIKDLANASDPEFPGQKEDVCKVCREQDDISFLCHYMAGRYAW